jgi:hypothetical protein
MGREVVVPLRFARHDVSVVNRGEHRVEWPSDAREFQGDRTVDHDLQRLRADDPGFGSLIAPDRLIDMRRAERAGVLPARVSRAGMIKESYEALISDPDRRVLARTDEESFVHEARG